LRLFGSLIKNPDVSDADKKATILDFDQVLGLKLDEMQTEDETVEIPDHVQKLLKEREIARGKKDWHTSDLIRNEIQALGFELKDTDDGQKVKERYNKQKAAKPLFIFLLTYYFYMLIYVKRCI
jgi:cysteinyl-tRNA synthetase